MSKKKTNKRLVLLDTHAILHRAYHALPDFASQNGEPTGALYGLSTMLLKLIADLEPDYVVAAFDLPKPTYRHEVYEDYKAGRSKTDDELAQQITRSRDVLSAFSIPIYEKEGFEADDMLGTIVESMKDNEDLEIIIASGDMDTLQLVDKKKVQVFTLKKGIKDTVLYDEKAVKERFGFGPELLPDYKGLRGDPSDNIIGIKGIGEKTATTLITKFGSIEDIYKKLEKGEDAFVKEGLTPRIIGLLKDNEEEARFSKMLALIRRDAPITFELPKEEWNESFDPRVIIKLFEDLSFRTLVARLRREYKLEGVSTDQGSLLKADPLTDDQILELGVMLWLIDSDKTHPSQEEIVSYTKTGDYTKAKEKLVAELTKNNLLKLYEEIEEPLYPILKEMKEHGVLLDTVYLKELSKKHHKTLDKLEKSIWKQAGEEFNINSPKQLGEILFDKMGVSTKGLKKTAGGARSTRESELEKLKDEYPIVEDILKYREFQKLLSTYIDPLPDQVGDDGRIHATFVQTGTTTGRMASVNPNLQNIPIRGEYGKEIREAFVAAPGFKILACDYSQLELRIAAMLSKDEKLIDIFKRGADVHTEVASQVYGVSIDKVTKDMRRHAKVINFGIMYGMGVNALKKNLGTSRTEAQEFYTTYFNTFTGLADYLEGVKSLAAKQGYTETYFGRRRYFEGITSKVPYIQAMAERMAINAPIQGTEADIVKIAMIRVDEYVKKNKLQDKVFMLMNVHDEIVFEVSDSVLKEATKNIKAIMESVILPKDAEGITFAVEAQAGKNWGDMKSVL